MGNADLIREVLDAYNREQGTHIIVREDVRGPMTPETDLEEQVVTYNPHAETLFLLLNIAKMHKSAGCHAVHHFLLYHLALGKDLYREAEALQKELESDIIALSSVIPIGERAFYKSVSSYQTLFVLGHEFSHVYYYLHQPLLMENCAKMRESLVWLRGQLGKDRPLLARLLHFLVPKMRYMQEHSFDEAIASAELQEELLCDEAAWRMARHIIVASVEDVDIRASLSAFVAYTLYHVEAQRTLENIYAAVDHAERQCHLMFDTTRSTVLVNTIWDDVAEDSRKSLSCYKSLVNDISRATRLRQMLALRPNLEHIRNIRFLPHGDYSPKELRRLNARYEEIMARMGM